MNKRKTIKKIAEFLGTTQVAVEKVLPGLLVKYDNNDCVSSGSLRFAEHRLGVSRQDVINGGHLFSVPASKLLATKDLRAEMVVRKAWERETTINI